MTDESCPDRSPVPLALHRTLTPSPRTASAPAVSVGAADAGKAGQWPGTRGFYSTDVPFGKRPVPTRSCPVPPFFDLGLPRVLSRPPIEGWSRIFVGHLPIKNS
jgi:hypothetical protein